jgi:hypothetical protein
MQKIIHISSRIQTHNHSVVAFRKYALHHAPTETKIEEPLPSFLACFENHARYEETKSCYADLQYDYFQVFRLITVSGRHSLWIFSCSHYIVWGFELFASQFTISHELRLGSILLAGSHGFKSCTMVIANGFTFKSFVAVHADNFETLVSCSRHLRDFWAICSNLALILSNFSSVSTWSFNAGFLSKNNPAFLNYLFNPEIYARIFSLLFFYNNFAHRHHT